jgi:hypothetical protein
VLWLERPLVPVLLQVPMQALPSALWRERPPEQALLSASACSPEQRDPLYILSR